MSTLILIVTLALSQLPPIEPAFAVTIEGEVSVDAGRLVKLHAAGNADVWVWDAPEGADVPDGRPDLLYFSTPVAGRYTVRLFAARWTGTVIEATKASVVVTVGNPPPGPGPEPPPQPLSLRDSVRQWSAAVKSATRDIEADKLASAYESVAATLAAGVKMSAEEVVAVTAAQGRIALGASREAWLPFFQALQAELNARDKKGPLDYAALWREIAEGLRASLPKPTPAKQVSVTKYIKVYTSAGKNCGACNIMKPIVAQMSKDGFDMQVITNFASGDNGVTRIPTFVGYQGGLETGRLVGVVTRSQLEGLLR